MTELKVLESLQILAEKDSSVNWDEVRVALNDISTAIYKQNKDKGFWDAERNVGELLMLMTSELGEALEAHRKDLNDDHLPHLKGFDTELADCLIRIFDSGGGLNIKLGDVLIQKLAYNLSRPYKHGKKY
jgi:NTP pyrophosphatase (non-canonical NTP hydrolase)